MSDFDKACRYAARMDAPGFLAWLLGPNSGLTFRRWLDTRTTPGAEHADRTGDLVADMAVNGVGPFWAVPVEFQTTPDPEMFGRGLEMLGRVWRENFVYGTPKDRYLVGLAVVNLTGRGDASRDMRAGRLATNLQAAELNLADEDAAVSVAAVKRGELARVVLCWVPLMRGGDDPALVAQWKAAAAGEPEGRRRANFGQLTITLSAAAGRKDVWQEGLEGWEMETSSYLDEIRAEVRAKSQAETLLRGLKLRFPEQVGPEVEERLRATTDEALLARLTDLAFTAPSLDDVRRALDG
jgi:hypothetical protein